MGRHVSQSDTPGSRLRYLISSGVSVTGSAEVQELISAGVAGPISAQTGNGWCRTYAAAMFTASTPFFFPSSRARLSRSKLSSAYQHRVISSSERLAGLPRAKNPRACDDQEKSGIFVRLSQARHGASLDARQPPQGASTIRARLKLFDSAPNPTRPFCFAYALAASSRSIVQFDPPNTFTRPAR